MTVRWYFDRLRSMESRELIFRAGERAKRWHSRGRVEGWTRFEDGGQTIASLPKIRAALLARADDTLREKLEADAAALLDGRFEALGVHWPQRSANDLFPPDVWRLDPVTGGLWAANDVYCFDIPYRHERRLGDIKYVWELNRLQFLQTLAAHHALTGNPASLLAIDRAINSWFDANPPFRGIGWNSGIEMALRSISLIVVASCCGDQLPKATQTRIRTLLSAHAYWIARFPSRYSSANNHLIAEAAGLLLISLAVPDAQGSKAYGATARKVLNAEALKQILDDGTPAEQSPTYGAFTCEFLLLARWAAEGAGRPLEPGVKSRLAAFSQYIRWLSDGNGLVPAIGDDDEGRVIWSGSVEPRYATSVASCILAQTGGEGLAAAPARWRTLREAILGGGESAQHDLPEGVSVFGTGGYTIVRETKLGRKLHLVVDHGPLGYLSIAAHGHADALAVILSIDDQPIFVDAGTYLYHSGGQWRDWFRGTRAHNTLCLENADQSLISGPFNWSQKAHAALDEHRVGPNWLLRAHHDGYVKRFGVRHQRTIEGNQNGLVIRDALLGAGKQRNASINFLLDPDCHVRAVESAFVIARGSRDVVKVTPSTGGSGRMEIVRAEDDGGAWVSTQFGHKTPSSALRWSGYLSDQEVQFGVDIL